MLLRSVVRAQAVDRVEEDDQAEGGREVPRLQVVIYGEQSQSVHRLPRCYSHAQTVQGAALCVQSVSAWEGTVFED